MNDDPTFLASAYLDGDVTDDERARVEADPALLAEVDRLRAVRLILGDIEPPPISVREAQLAEALATWDRLPDAERTGARRDVTPSGIDAAAVAGAAAVTAPTPLRDRRRTRSSRWLVGAAAAMVLVLAGGVALQLASNGDEGSTADDAESTSELVAPAAAPSADDEARAEADPALAGDAALDAVTDGSQLDTGISDVAPPGEDAGLDQLETPADLADFAAAALDAPVAPDVPAATSAPADEDLSAAESAIAEVEFPLCLGVDVIVGPAVYGDVPVVVGIDEGRNLAIAYRAATCAEVARARLP
jgi:hypothetical protein